MPYTKKKIPNWLACEIHERDCGICQICGKEGEWKYIGKLHFSGEIIKGGILYSRKKWRRFHVDHILPEWAGGKTTHDNLRLTCMKCNLTRVLDDMGYYEYLEKSYEQYEQEVYNKYHSEEEDGLDRTALAFNTA